MIELKHLALMLAHFFNLKVLLSFIILNYIFINSNYIYAEEKVKKITKK